MTIPDFQTLMRPFLELHADGGEHLNRDLVEQLAIHFELSEDEKRVMLPSGGSRLFDNRVGWAKFHLSKAGVLESPKRAVSRITPRGQQLLKDHPDRIDMKVLDQFEEYHDFRTPRKSQSTEGVTEKIPDDEQLTPEEQLENAYLSVREQVEHELLTQIMDNPPEFLEQVVVDLVVQMGYGGSRKDAGEALGRSGDAGIDGIIKEDVLGLDIIYLQAKRWEGSVGRPELQKFAGALQGQRARKGIFITTSSFTKEALDFVSKIDTKIILIDGERLARLMFDHGIGVSTASTYTVKRIDSDYFSDV